MNRREILKGLATSLALAAVPIPLPPAEVVTEVYGYSPAMQALGTLEYLNRIKKDILTRIVNPPMLMAEDGTLTAFRQTHLIEALGHVNQLLEDMS